MGLVAFITPPQGPELILILAVVVLLFGAKKLPELGSSIGKSITNFKKGVAEGQAEGEDTDANEADANQAVESDAVESGSEDRDSSGS